MTRSPIFSWCAVLHSHSISLTTSVRVIENPEPAEGDVLFPKLRLSADIASPTSYPYPVAVIVTLATEPPETTIVAFPSFPLPVVATIGTFKYVPSA